MQSQAPPAPVPKVKIIFTNRASALDAAATQLQFSTPRSNIQALETAYTAARGTIINLCNNLISGNPLLRSVSTTIAGPPRLVIVDWSDRPGSRSNGIRLLELPKSFSAFLDPASERHWKGIFESILFRGFREFCGPATDLVYLLQCFMPGMISLRYMTPGETRDRLNRVTAILPPLEWMRRNKAWLSGILGEDRVNRIVHAQQPQHSFAHPLGLQVDRNVLNDLW